MTVATSTAAARARTQRIDHRSVAWRADVATTYRAVRETVILLHPPLFLAGVSTGMKRGCQHNGRLADG